MCVFRRTASLSSRQPSHIPHPSALVLLVGLTTVNDTFGFVSLTTLKKDVKVCSFYFCTSVLCTAVDGISEKTIKEGFFGVFLWLIFSV